MYLARNRSLADGFFTPTGSPDPPFYTRPALRLSSSSIVIALAAVFLNSLGGSARASTVSADTPVTEHGTTLSDVSGLLDFHRVPAPPSEGLHGTTWLDYDNDGDLDLYLTNGPGFANALFRNDDGAFTDVAAEAGVTGGGGGAGAVAADIDNDGWVDLFVIGAGGIGSPAAFGTPHTLYVNNQDGTFSDITGDAGISGPHPAMMAAFGDIDNDGDLDLFITNPGSFVTGMEPQVLYLNNGDRTFTDISASAGIDTSSGGCVVNFFDYDKDGWSDILVGNCNLLVFPGDPPGTPVPGPWELWRNNHDGTFSDMAGPAGLTARPGFPMALTIADYDNDGDLDFFATGLGSFFNSIYPGILSEQVLFRNNGDGTFSDVTYAAGLGGLEWGWGASFADFDNDGDEDLLAAGSMPPMFGVIGPGLASPGRLYENDGAGGFTCTQTFGLEFDYTSGLAVADFDGDGFQDAVITTSPYAPGTRDTPVLLHNDGNANHWLTVKLVGTSSNRDGVGAVVRAKLKQEIQVKQVQAGTSFASGNGLLLTFGLGRRDSVDLKVTWPSGLVEEFDDIQGDQLVTLVEGEGAPD